MLGLDFKDALSLGASFGSLWTTPSVKSKFKARIPVPDSYQLVGVADEGQAYIEEDIDKDDVFTLEPGRIYGTFFLWGFTVVLPHTNEDIQSVYKRPQMIHPSI